MLTACRTLVLVLALLSGTPASAAVYRVIVEGVVLDGVDETGVFGAPGSLTGERYSVTYAFDPNNPWRYTEPGLDIIDSGVTATFRLKGVVHTFPGPDPLVTSVVATPGSLGFLVESVTDANPVDIQIMEHFLWSDSFQADLDFPIRGLVPATGNGAFWIDTCCCPSCGPSFEEVFARGTLSVDLVRLAVPEPLTWSLMVAGFGLAGAGLRRRRGVRTAA